jgi:hypothetical protein
MEMREDLLTTKDGVLELADTISRDVAYDIVPVRRFKPLVAVLPPTVTCMNNIAGYATPPRQAYLCSCGRL